MSRSSLKRIAQLAPIAIAALTLARDASSAPAAMTRDEILALAKPVVGFSYWWGHGAYRNDGAQHGTCTPDAGSSGCPSCSHSGSYGADCSGFVAKAWQIPSPSPITTDAHPYSTSTFVGTSSNWSSISRTDAKPMDAFVYNTGGAGHIFLYESGDPWGSLWAYECKGCSYGCVHDLRTASSTYSAIRRAGITVATPPPPPPAAAKYAGTFVSQSFPLAADGAVVMKVGETLDGWFDLKNTGTATWSTKSTHLAIAPRTSKTSPLSDASWLAPDRPGAVAKDTPPDAIGRFSIKLHATAIGDTTQGFALVEEGTTWFADAPLGGGPADDVLKVRVVVGDGTVDATPPPTHDEGDPLDAGALDASTDGSALADAPAGDVKGGCGCHTTGADPSGNPAWIALGGLSAFVALRRRRDRA